MIIISSSGIASITKVNPHQYIVSLRMNWWDAWGEICPDSLTVAEAKRIVKKGLSRELRLHRSKDEFEDEQFKWIGLWLIGESI